MKIVFTSLMKASDWVNNNVDDPLEQEKVFMKIIRQFRMSDELYLHINRSVCSSKIPRT
jgi:hypothetical protein